MDQLDELLVNARARIVADTGHALDEDGESAARLLADLYRVGLDHNVAPSDWAAVTSLPGASLDATRALSRRERVADERSLRDGLRLPASAGLDDAVAAQPLSAPPRADQRGRGRAR